MATLVLRVSTHCCKFRLGRVLSSSAVRFAPRGITNRHSDFPLDQSSTSSHASKPATGTSSVSDYEYFREKIREAKSQGAGQVHMPVVVELDERIPRDVTDEDYRKNSSANGLRNAEEEQPNNLEDKRAARKAKKRSGNAAKPGVNPEAVTQQKPKRQSETDNSRSDSAKHGDQKMEESRSAGAHLDRSINHRGSSARSAENDVVVAEDGRGEVANTSDDKAITVAEIPELLSRLERDLRAFDPLRVRPKIQPRGNLAAYVNDSETLQQLVRLGVRLYEVERVPGAANLFVKLNYAVDVEPVLRLMRERFAVRSNQQIAEILTGFPTIFRVPFKELDALVTYLESKCFSSSDIAKLVVREPSVLSFSVVDLDAKLGSLQKEFGLSGDQIRAIVNDKPKLLLRPFKQIRDVHVTSAKYLGFQKAELRQLVTNAPGVLLTNRDLLLRNFDYLHNTMMLEHAHILSWPKALHADIETLRNRHLFLVHIGKAQYDPKAPCFVSLAALIDNTDQQFCVKVAETDLQTYRNFLKTL